MPKDLTSMDLTSGLECTFKLVCEIENYIMQKGHNLAFSLFSRLFVDAMTLSIIIISRRLRPVIKCQMAATFEISLTCSLAF